MCLSLGSLKQGTWPHRSLFILVGEVAALASSPGGPEAIHTQAPLLKKKPAESSVEGETSSVPGLGV